MFRILLIASSWKLLYIFISIIYCTMKKSLFSLIITLLCVQITYSQQEHIKYGDNPAAGKYYDVRGIKMYAEVYGQGKPLLLIHGNGGSISAFSQTSLISQKSIR